MPGRVLSTRGMVTQVLSFSELLASLCPHQEAPHLQAFVSAVPSVWSPPALFSPGQFLLHFKTQLDITTSRKAPSHPGWFQCPSPVSPQHSRNIPVSRHTMTCHKYCGWDSNLIEVRALFISIFHSPGPFPVQNRYSNISWHIEVFEQKL